MLIGRYPGAVIKMVCSSSSCGIAKGPGAAPASLPSTYTLLPGAFETTRNAIVATVLALAVGLALAAGSALVAGSALAAGLPLAPAAAFLPDVTVVGLLAAAVLLPVMRLLELPAARAARLPTGVALVALLAWVAAGGVNCVEAAYKPTAASSANTANAALRRGDCDGAPGCSELVLGWRVPRLDCA